MNAYEQVEKKIREGGYFLVGSHINPDGDAVGSTLAVGAALKHLGKQVVMYNRDPVPSNLDFLRDASLIVTDIPDREFDAAIMVDCASKDRAGQPFVNAKIKGPLIVIDHHRIDSNDMDLALIDESAASAGEVVLRLIEHMKVPMTPEIAMYVYCTLAVDTGFFRYSNTTGRILKVAADLVAAGAHPWTVARNLEESYSVERFRLLAKALATLDVSEDGKFASMEVTQKMAKDAEAPMQISEEFAGIPRSIKSVKVSALFREIEKDRIRVSLRSKDDIDVASVAANFGGGGHPYAAGCTVKGSMDHAKKVIREIIQDKIKNRKT